MIIDSDPLLLVRIFLGLALSVAITLAVCEAVSIWTGAAGDEKASD
ncbi:MAG TPA: hypothetical protein VE224_02630 [Pseudolabrys sp.]|jgi:hypothetical protein|nr:hypothetical protein [Pseudolabrys sp.]